MILRMPVSGKDDRHLLLLERLYHIVQRFYNLVSVSGREGPSGAEVTLDVNDDQRPRPVGFHPTSYFQERRGSAVASITSSLVVLFLIPPRLSNPPTILPPLIRGLSNAVACSGGGRSSSSTVS